MNKNVLILSGSPRKGGNSDTLCDEFMKGAIDAGHQVEKIFLRDKKVNYCTGCGVCYNQSKPCPQKDDAAEIVDKMIHADVIVMATPVYFYTALKRTFEGFRGFTSCLEGANEKGIISGIGVWQIGEINNSATMKKAYTMGNAII